MSRARFPDPSQLDANSRAQLARIEAQLALIVNARETQALLARSREGGHDKEEIRARLTLNLQHLVRQLLDKELPR